MLSWHTARTHTASYHQSSGTDWQTRVLSIKIIKAYTASPDVACVMHMTPKPVLQAPEYGDWMASFASQQGNTLTFLQ
jgi:hypothetical protein